MDRKPPRSTSDEIDLYIRTYYSLLRSTGDVRVRALEEVHMFSNSSLHEGASRPELDAAAFAYSAGRLPECMPFCSRVIMGQSIEQFEAAGFYVRDWKTVTARGRRRAMRWNELDNLAVFITSASDIDDLVPILAAYQIEWNKIHGGLSANFESAVCQTTADLASALQIEVESAERIVDAFGVSWREALLRAKNHVFDLSLRLLAGSFTQYETSAQRWWGGIERNYVKGAKRRPVYFVSSNTHSLINLLGGYARNHRDAIMTYAKTANPEGLADAAEKSLQDVDPRSRNNLSYYLLRRFLKETLSSEEKLQSVQSYDAESGIHSIASPGRIDVNAQVIEIAKLKPERMDERVICSNPNAFRKSDAVIINIDYPLGLAGYHHLARLAQGCGEIRGVYVMGKAATLNGRVGDVMIPKAVYDEHSKNTYLFRNSFRTADVQTHMHFGTVMDNQKAVTVRSAFLQNRDYMSVFYEEGYTILEMEAGPYLSAVYEMIHPERYPNDEIVNLCTSLPFDFGMLHYASDTPYSRRQSLLSKSMSYFGVESTYACALAIVNQILRVEAGFA